MDHTNNSASEFLEKSEKSLESGQFFNAYEDARRGLEWINQYPESVSDTTRWMLKRAEVLSLARMGAYEQAYQKYHSYKLDFQKAKHYPGFNYLKISALCARVEKDQALTKRCDKRALLQAANAYQSLFEDTQHPADQAYPAINAATLYFLAGEVEKAMRLARTVLNVMQHKGGQSDPFYDYATQGEAYLLLGELEKAQQAYKKVAQIAHQSQSWGKLSTTRRQLKILSECIKDDSCLKQLAAPRVAHGCGHRIDKDSRAPRFPVHQEAAVARVIRQLLQQHRVKMLYSGLAHGADILLAEALLEQQGELYIVLPFAEPDYIQRSVQDGPGDWQKRFKQCIDHPNSQVIYATKDQSLVEDGLFSYASELAMGLALLKAEQLQTDAVQIAIWDGKVSSNLSGTGGDIKIWQHIKQPTWVIPPLQPESAYALTEVDQLLCVENQSKLSQAQGLCEQVAILFGDVKGFSKLKDEQLKGFVEQVLGVFASVFKKYSAHILMKNTWGDGLFIILDDVEIAARCALELQQQLKHDPTYKLRLGGHFGPVLKLYDPILERDNFFGSEVSRTARIEPITAPGQVYVTDMFAAQLALHSQHLTTEYVGEMSLAKSWGAAPMYALREKHHNGI